MTNETTLASPHQQHFGTQPPSHRCRQPRHELAPRKGPLPAPPSPRGRSLASLFDMDRIFLRVPSDEDAETDLLSNLSVHP